MSYDLDSPEHALCAETIARLRGDFECAVKEGRRIERLAKDAREQGAHDARPLDSLEMSSNGVADAIECGDHIDKSGEGGRER